MLRGVPFSAGLSRPSGDLEHSLQLASLSLLTDTVAPGTKWASVRAAPGLFGPAPPRSSQSRAAVWGVCLVLSRGLRPRGRGFRGGHLAAGPRRGRPRGGACRGGAADTDSRRRCRAGARDAAAPRQG